ncbi:hypothetical protein M9H77_08274 [Catharanthus roseus]|uniref:Uncharacterized protein n=1 Tax=Catharanthus roseus TaxID=4058 RepID=A0ACC0BXL1_CATRO|nr:hypothetical protein M9H77_08274 [Catharanthus roseus]
MRRGNIMRRAIDGKPLVFDHTRHAQCLGKSVAKEEEEEDEGEDAEDSDEEYDESDSSIRGTFEQLQISQFKKAFQKLSRPIKLDFLDLESCHRGFYRSTTNREDFCCNQGHVEMKVLDSKLLQRANRVYTIGAYKLFENQFMKFPEYCQGFVDPMMARIELNMDAQEYVEEGLRTMKDKIITEVGPHYVYNSKNASGSSNVKDPVG